MSTGIITGRHERLHDLDAMRSILMLLGVALHAANPYRPGSRWLVTDSVSHPFLGWMFEAFHLFRIPGFFVVAGFFAMLSLERRTTPAFLKERLTRLVIPCLTTLLLINIPQTLWLSTREIPGQPPLAALTTAWGNGDLIGHLWFLVDLALYLVVVAAFAGVLRKTLLRNTGESSASPWPPRLLVGAGAAWAVGLTVLGHFGPDWLHRQVGGLINPLEWLDYAPFFAVGAVMYKRPRLLQSFGAPGLIDVVVAAGMAVVWLQFRHTKGIAAPISAAAQAILCWVLVRACFAAFRRWASRPSPFFRYLSDASYTVYLFHHIVVLLVAAALIPVSLPALLKFAIVLVTASLASLTAYHFLIRPSQLMTFLFNGKPTTARSR